MIAEYRHNALTRGNGLHWAIRLRLLLIVPRSCRWNAWVRHASAWLEDRNYVR